MKGLTPRQNQILDFLRERVVRDGFPPTLSEIVANFDLGSTNAAADHLRALTRKGFIERDFGRARAIRIRGVVPGDHRRRRLDGLPVFEGLSFRGNRFAFVAPARGADGVAFFPPTPIVHEPTR